MLAAILCCAPVLPAFSQDQANIPALTPQQQGQLGDLAGRVLQHADRAGCKKNDCTILVANFTGSSGSTSALGLQLADTLSSQLVAQAKDIQIVDRSRLQSFLDRERIPSKLLEDDRAAGWLASELSASAVLVGFLKREDTGVRLRVQLLNARDALKKEKKKKDKVSSEEMVLPLQNPDNGLAPAEPFGKLSSADTTPQGEEIFKAGVSGMTLPRCFYHPDPQYLDAARSAKFQGTVLLDITIMLDERIGAVDVVRGAPYGLNEAARKSVATWRCKSSSRGGTPVATRVPVEITFRLY